MTLCSPTTGKFSRISKHIGRSVHFYKRSRLLTRALMTRAPVRRRRLRRRFRLDDDGSPPRVWSRRGVDISPVYTAYGLLLFRSRERNRADAQSYRTRGDSAGLSIPALTARVSLSGPSPPRIVLSRNVFIEPVAVHRSPRKITEGQCPVWR